MDRSLSGNRRSLITLDCPLSRAMTLTSWLRPVIVLGFMMGLSVPATAADTVLLHAAGSLRGALTEVSNAFEKQSRRRSDSTSTEIASELVEHHHLRHEGRLVADRREPMRCRDR